MHQPKRVTRLTLRRPPSPSPRRRLQPESPAPDALLPIVSRISSKRPVKTKRSLAAPERRRRTTRRLRRRLRADVGRLSLQRQRMPSHVEPERPKPKTKRPSLRRPDAPGRRSQTAKRQRSPDVRRAHAQRRAPRRRPLPEKQPSLSLQSWTARADLAGPTVLSKSETVRAGRVPALTNIPPNLDF